MSRLLFRMIALLLSTCAWQMAGAQRVDDLDIRQRPAISYRGKDFTLTGKYFLFTSEGGTVFWRSMAGLEASYKMNKWLKAGGEYRFATSHNGDFHRFYAYLVFDKNYHKWSAAYRPMYQQDVTYFDPAAQNEYPVTLNIRHLFDITWHYSKKMDFYTNAELYYRLEHAQLAARRQVYAAGVSYLYKKRNQFSVELAMYHTPASTARADVLRASISYTWLFGEKTGKKKKKHQHTSK